jgi:hypothetical protein
MKFIPNLVVLLMLLLQHKVISDGTLTASCNNMTSLTSAFSCLSSKNTIAYIHTDGSLEKENQTGYISLSFLSLSNTYLVSKLNFNLIFVGQLCDLGSTLTFTSFGYFL